MGGTISDIRQDVRAIVSELEHNVTSTHTMVSDIHRNTAKGQEGNNGTDPSVSRTHILSITE